MSFVPGMQRVMEGSELRSITLGHPLVDAYLEFVGARGAVNTWLATAYDLKVFFEVVGKEPAEVTPVDVFAFLAQQRSPRRENLVRIEDGEAGLSARTIARRLSSIAGLFDYLIVRGDADVERNPVPRGLAGRRPGQRGRGGVRLVRRPKTLPRVLSLVEVDALLGALRTQRDRAIVLAMLLAGLRRGMPLTAAGLDEVIDGARGRAGLGRLTCHMLRHTCLTRLREQGMSLEALQAQAGHASIESTRIYLHLADDWLRGEYMRAAEAIDTQADPTEGEAA